VSVFIYSEDALKILFEHVGKIIYLKNFIVASTSQPFIELKPSENSDFQLMEDNFVNKDIRVTSRVQELRYWMIQNLQHLFKPILGLKLLDEISLVADDFHMVFEIKYVHTDKADKGERKYELKDLNGNTYWLEIDSNISAGNYIIVYHIICIRSNFSINKSKLTHMMVVPFEVYNNYVAVHSEGFRVKKNTEKSAYYTIIRSENSGIANTT
jgi:hypothetical protein